MGEKVNVVLTVSVDKEQADELMQKLSDVFGDFVAPEFSAEIVSIEQQEQ